MIKNELDSSNAAPRETVLPSTLMTPPRVDLEGKLPFGITSDSEERDLGMLLGKREGKANLHPCKCSFWVDRDTCIYHLEVGSMRPLLKKII